ncbi:MAG: hypothetical protein SFW36_06345 [Leptolyngbyaceae cyanobacterium bins.59]|nr:hypothetical protein [Leptolyngbyaceae cyanobacterium bins.59]
MSPMMLQTNGNAKAAQARQWLQASVKEFFSGVNWDDQPLEVQVLKQNNLAATEGPLSLTLTVGQFFGAIPWEGGPSLPKTAAIDMPLVDQTKADDFTLDDFSSLF